MSDELPQGWTVATLGEICSKPQYGWTCRAAKTGDIKYVRTTDISAGGINWETVPFCEEAPKDVEKYRVSENDILVSRAGSVGVSFRIVDVPCDAVFASYLIRFKPINGIPPKYVEFFLNSESYWRSISEFSAGIAVPNVNASKLASLDVPLAPLPEQRRIVAKLEKLLSQVDACQQRLAKVPTLLKRFRQSILAAACSGRLTVDWREEHAGEAADTLASTLGTQRKEFWEHREMARAKASGKSLDGDKWKHRYKIPFSPSNDFQNDLPATWGITTVSQIALLDVGFAFKSSEFSNEGIRLLRGENLEPGRLRWTDTQCWPAERLQGLEYLLIEDGEIILALDRPVISTGLKIARAIKCDLPCLLVQRMMRLKMVEPRMTDWLFYNLNLPEFIRHLSEGLTGSDIPHVTGTGVAEYTFGLPPLPEQQEIVRRVESLFALADQLEAQLAKAQAQVDKLTPSLLARAFAGKLVPQDPKDEPAGKLLARIRATQPKLKQTEA